MAKLEQIRNIGVVAHIDAGKTTTSERLLFYTGRIHRTGEVHHGDAQMDWMDQEQERGITITAAATNLEWRKHSLRLIDTPGHVDFNIEVERSLRVLDGAVVVLCANGGVEPQTETVWRQAERFTVPRLVFINKMDRVGADMQRVQAQLRDLLGARPAQVHLPLFDGSQFVGMVDLLNRRTLGYSGDLGEAPAAGDWPVQVPSDWTTARDKLIEAVADYDDALAEDYLGGEEIAADRLLASLRAATIAGHLQPVFCGSALKNMGIEPLLDAIVDLLPSPADRRLLVKNPDGDEPIELLPDPKAPLVALAFKVQHLGDRRVVFTRIYAGSLSTGQAFWVPRLATTERALRIVEVHADRKKTLKSAQAGDIVVLLGPKKIGTGDTLLGDKKQGVVLEALAERVPVISVALEADNMPEREKLLDGLRRVADEDPTLRFLEDDEAGQLLLSGMGELHLEVVVEALRRSLDISIRVGKPTVVYRETVSGPGVGEFRFERKTEDKHLLGVARVKVEPLVRGGGVVVVAAESPEGGAAKIWDDARASLESAAGSSGAQGFALDDLCVTLLHAELPIGGLVQAVRSAASGALRRAVQDAGSTVLEPWGKLVVRCREPNLGEVLGDLAQRGARISDVGGDDSQSIVEAQIPIARTFGYATALRSMTQGRASFALTPTQYDA